MNPSNTLRNLAILLIAGFLAIMAILASMATKANGYDLASHALLLMLVPLVSLPIGYILRESRPLVARGFYTAAWAWIPAIIVGLTTFYIVGAAFNYDDTYCQLPVSHCFPDDPWSYGSHFYDSLCRLGQVVALLLYGFIIAGMVRLKKKARAAVPRGTVIRGLGA